MLPRPGKAAIAPNDTVCRVTQDSQKYNNDTLLIAAGSAIVLQYNENGHVTKPWNNDPGKSGSGHVWIYGTYESNHALLDVYDVWNETGNGGDGKGQLLTHMPFDDGKCYQYSTDSPLQAERESKYGRETGPGQSLWCRSEVRIPLFGWKDLWNRIYPDDPANASIPYTIYWVWAWPFSDGRPTFYSSCLDVRIRFDASEIPNGQ